MERKNTVKVATASSCTTAVVLEIVNNFISDGGLLYQLLRLF